MVTIEDLQCYLALTVLSDISGWSNRYKSETVQWFMSRTHWPYLAYNAINYGFSIERLDKRELKMLEEYCELNKVQPCVRCGGKPPMRARDCVKNAGSSRSEPQGAH